MRQGTSDSLLTLVLRDAGAMALLVVVFPSYPLCRQRRHNLLAILGALSAQDFAPDTLIRLPLQHRQGAVRCLRDMLPGLLDQPAQFG